jgi:hypothetical protein
MKSLKEKLKPKAVAPFANQILAEVDFLQKAIIFIY